MRVSLFSRKELRKGMRMDYYSKDLNEVFSDLNSSGSGLTAAEAKKRLEEHGKNKLAEAKRTGPIKRFLKQLADPMIIILIVAAILSGITSVWEGEAPTDVFIILFIVILNSVLGVVQESKAEKAIDALKEMTAATSKVLRDGSLVHIKSEELVPGDVIILEAGDSVPADSRLIESASLKAEEAALTGESVAVLKDTDAVHGEDVPLGDRTNMVYTGSTVVYGRGRAVVTATGMDTEMGKIAGALTAAKDDATPLQKKLSSLSRVLTVAVLAICVFMFVFGVVRAGAVNADVMINTFMLSVSLAVAAIPEGLAAVVTIVLSIGVTKMSKRNAVIRRLTAVETLGCTQVICSDKTGTLTQNKMTVVEACTENGEMLALAMTLCSDSVIDREGNVTGEPTENALVSYGASVGLYKYDLDEITPRCGEFPFDSVRKLMTTVHPDADEFISYTKGAPDELLEKCTSFLTADGPQPMTAEKKKEILSDNKRMADGALRVLAAGMKRYSEIPKTMEEAESDLCFIGLVGMIDPVRPEVEDAVAECRGAGIRVVMITGDHVDTAVAIGKSLGMLEDRSGALTGAELDRMTDEELYDRIGEFSVYARVKPEHKVRIVNTWRKHGMICAMTGDGVNDAPGIKSADIGVGMGITGTDVTKNVADMILADDNFATIVGAVDEGRRIYANIRKAIQFLLSSNLSEVLGVFVATLLGFRLLLPVHMLWINLITDSLPALALGMEPSEEDSMKKPPRSSKEGLFSGGVGFDVIYQGALVAILTLLAYFIGHRMEAGRWEITNSPDGMTMAFLTMSMAEIFQSLNMRSRRGSIFTLKKQNIWLWGAAAVALLLVVAVIYIPPLARAFSFESISAVEFLTAFGLSLTIIPLVEFVKLIERSLSKK